MSDINLQRCDLCKEKFVQNGFLVKNPCTITVHGTRDYSPGYPPTDIALTVCSDCFDAFMRKLK